MQFRIATLIQITALMAAVLTIAKLSRGAGGTLALVVLLLTAMALPVLVANLVASPAEDQTLKPAKVPARLAIGVVALILVMSTMAIVGGYWILYRVASIFGGSGF